MTTTPFDPLDRPSTVTWADSSTTTLTWDLGNRLTQVVDSISGTITRQWDELDRLQYEQTPQGRIDYTYDNAGRRQTMTVLGQTTVNYNWDNADRPQSLTQGSAVARFGYDDANRRTSLTFPNGILATSAYNARDLTGITFTKGGNTLGALTYTTDADGRRTLVGGTWARTNLPAAITTTLYNANNQQTKVGTKTLTYDLNGNLTKDGNGNITYTWDARDRLTATSASNSTFQYDPLGRRTKKVIGGTTTRFHYDGVNPVQELDNAGNVLANLLTGLGIDEPFTRSGGSGTRTLLGDALNSTLALADDTGTVQTSYTYEPFGTSSVTGQSNTNTYQYTGRENDGTGLDYYRARYYSPTRQRFISEDPIGFAGGDPNLYAYVGDDPLGYLDALGLTRMTFDVAKGLLTVDPERDGEAPYTIPGTSGTGACMNQPKCQTNKNRGLIPKGQYYVLSNEIAEPGRVRAWWWNRPRSLGGGDWGSFRVPIHPDKGTAMPGRDPNTFKFHGGNYPGSAGCVDIGGGTYGSDITRRVLRDLRSDPDGRIPLLVK